MVVPWAVKKWARVRNLEVIIDMDVLQSCQIGLPGLRFMRREHGSSGDEEFWATPSTACFLPSPFFQNLAISRPQEINIDGSVYPRSSSENSLPSRRSRFAPSITLWNRIIDELRLIAFPVIAPPTRFILTKGDS